MGVPGVIIVNGNLRLHATGAGSNNGKDLKAMSKRTLTMMVAMLAALLIATTGTLAYLTDTDGAVNVMTIGNVDIEQLEYERVEDENGDWISTGEEDKYGYTPDEIQEFTQNKPLLPAVYQDGKEKWDDRVDGHQQSWGQLESEAGNPAPGSNQLFDDSVQNVVDKFVFVENTGKTPTYVRTWFAFEQGDLTADEYETLIHTNGDKDHWSWETVGTDVEIDGNKYVVAVATYMGPTSNPTGILEPGYVTYPSLLQLFMDPTATNEDLEAVDGNDTGAYEVLTFSQAIQATGFEKAQDALTEGFGEATVENHPWQDGIVTVASDDDLLDAINDPDVSIIYVDGELTYDWGTKSYADSEALKMQGKTFIGKDEDSSITFKGYGSANPIKNVDFLNITIKDETVGDNESSWEHGYLEMEDVTATNVTFADSIRLSGNSTLVDCTVDNTVASWYGAWVSGGNVRFVRCEFTGTRAIKIHERYGSEVESVSVEDCTFELSEKPGVVIGDLNADSEVTITGSTFDTQAGDQSKYIYESDTDVSTFTFSESGNTVL